MTVETALVCLWCSSTILPPFWYMLLNTLNIQNWGDLVNSKFGLVFGFASFFIWNRILHTPSWSQTHYVSKDVFECCLPMLNVGITGMNLHPQLFLPFLKKWFYVHWCFPRMYVYVTVSDPLKLELQTVWTAFWEFNLASLEEQSVLLTAEPSL